MKAQTEITYSYGGLTVVIVPGNQHVTAREADVLYTLCRPVLGDDAFVAPATVRDIAADLVVTEAAVKQHLLRLYDKFDVGEGTERRARLANEVMRRGVVRRDRPEVVTR